MRDPLATETKLITALRLTARPPQDWIDGAAMIPGTLGDLDAIERTIAAPGFRERFKRDPRKAVIEAGLPPSAAMTAAVSERLAG